MFIGWSLEGPQAPEPADVARRFQVPGRLREHIWINNGVLSRCIYFVSGFAKQKGRLSYYLKQLAELQHNLSIRRNQLI
jgi:hypothetical protein